jgi:hypothetical protein
MRAILIGKDGAVQFRNVAAESHEREQIVIPSAETSVEREPGRATFTTKDRRFQFVGTTPGRIRVYEEV